MNNNTINISRAEYEELQRKANFFSKVSALLTDQEIGSSKFDKDYNFFINKKKALFGLPKVEKFLVKDILSRYQETNSENKIDMNKRNKNGISEIDKILYLRS